MGRESNSREFLDPLKLADYAASLQSQQLSEASVKAYLKEVKSDRDNLQFRLQEANTILQETRIQLKALDAETDKLRQSLASSKKLQTEQNKLIHELKETVASSPSGARPSSTATSRPETTRSRSACAMMTLPKVDLSVSLSARSPSAICSGKLPRSTSASLKSPRSRQELQGS